LSALLRLVHLLLSAPLRLVHLLLSAPLHLVYLLGRRPPRIGDFDVRGAARFVALSVCGAAHLFQLRLKGAAKPGELSFGGTVDLFRVPLGGFADLDDLRLTLAACLRSRVRSGLPHRAVALLGCGELHLVDPAARVLLDLRDVRLGLCLALHVGSSSFRRMVRGTLALGGERAIQRLHLTKRGLPHVGDLGVGLAAHLFRRIGGRALELLGKRREVALELRAERSGGLIQGVAKSVVERHSRPHRIIAPRGPPQSGGTAMPRVAQR
jgi:hypothetical protein